MAPLLVLGTTRFAEEIADVAADCPGVELAGFVENLEPERCKAELAGLPVLWLDDAAGLAATHLAVCGLGTTRRSAFTAAAEERGFRFATLVHPTAHVSRTATLGTGTLVGAGVVVGAHARLGQHVLVNRAASVGHHTEIGDHCSIQAGAHVAGSCSLGASVYVGMGALVLDHRSIGEGTVVGAGAVVARDLPARVRAVGVPARVVAEEVEPL
jgi:sugar O-acyltransferase (sialic acid O-acetyltransferase NeuD family)